MASCFLTIERRVIRVASDRKPAPAKKRPSCFRERPERREGRGWAGMGAVVVGGEGGDGGFDEVEWSLSLGSVIVVPNDHILLVVVFGLFATCWISFLVRPSCIGSVGDGWVGVAGY